MTSKLATQLREGTSKSHTMAENVNFIKSFLGGGQQNTLSSSYGVVVGGFGNNLIGSVGAIVSGTQNTNCGSNGFVGAGRNNTIGADGCFSYILGVQFNQATNSW
jgi:hypothetical protein